MKRQKHKGQPQAMSKSTSSANPPPSQHSTETEEQHSTTDEKTEMRESSQCTTTTTEDSKILTTTEQKMSSITAVCTPHEKSSGKPEKKHATKRRKLNTTIQSLFQSIDTCINEDKPPPLVLSPRSLFKQLCRIHNDVYPNLLPENTLNGIFETLPSAQ